MKKIVIGLLLSTMFLGACTSNANTTTENSSTIKSSENSTSESTTESIALYVSRPAYYLENNNFHLAGKADPQKTVTITTSGELVKEITPSEDGSFSITVPLPETETQDFELTDGTTNEKVSIKSKAELQKAADEVEAKRKEQEKQKAEAEKKAAEDAAAKEQAEKEAAEKKKKEAEEAAKKAAEEEKASYDTGVTFENLARNPDTYLAEKVKFSGRIIQVIKGDDQSQFRFAIDDNYDQVILIEISEDQLSNNRLLEDDYITIRGVSFGEYTYTSALGGEITVPAVVVDSFEMNN